MKNILKPLNAHLSVITILLLSICLHSEKVQAQVLPFDSITSYLMIYDIDSRASKVVYKVKSHFEAPNWTRDGNFLLFNCHGRLYKKIAFGCDEPSRIESGIAVQCNNDHGFSPDGKWIAVSNQQDGKSLIFIVPSSGGEARQVTANGPSYWHGWSPDGLTLAYCASRNNQFDIYTIPVSGGNETRLTDAPGLDDGPDYSADGKWIYFNSERTGHMQIWRMHPDGSNQEQVTKGEMNDWFPHPSPDGKWIVFISFEKDVKGHPTNKNVILRMILVTGGEPIDLVRLFGGQGTMNVPSWSPDSKKFAYVKYELPQK
jgi:TolB protein